MVIYFILECDKASITWIHLENTNPIESKCYLIFMEEFLSQFPNMTTSSFCLEVHIALTNNKSQIKKVGRNYNF